MDEWVKICRAEIRMENERRLTTAHHNAPAPTRKCCYEDIVDWARKVIKEATKC